MSVFMDGQGFADYRDLWRWSVDDLPGFWRAIWEHFDVQADGDPVDRAGPRGDARRRLVPRRARCPMPSTSSATRTTPRSRFSTPPSCGRLDHWTWGMLRDAHARIRAGLRAMGIGPGDRVAAYMPNIPETLAAFLATASLGATWSCVLAGPRRPHRHRPLRPDRTEGPARRRRLPLRRPRLRPSRDRGRPARRAADRRRRRHAALSRTGRRLGAGTTSRRPPSRWRSIASPSTTRCGSCTPAAPPACPRRSSRATAGSCWSTSRR